MVPIIQSTYHQTYSKMALTSIFITARVKGFQCIGYEYSNVMYVVGYMIKSEKVMAELLSTLQNNAEVIIYPQKLYQIGSAVTGTRVVGLLEALMRQNSVAHKKRTKASFVGSHLKDEK